jgi:hypothetical protein
MLKLGVGRLGGRYREQARSHNGFSVCSRFVGELAREGRDWVPPAARPTPAECWPCTRESASRPGDGSAPPAAAHWGTARSQWCRTAGRSAVVRHRRCNRSAQGARNRALPWPRLVQRGSCVATGPFLQARWSPAHSSHGSPVRTRTRESAGVACEFFDRCSSSRQLPRWDCPGFCLKSRAPDSAKRPMLPVGEPTAYAP